MKRNFSYIFVACLCFFIIFAKKTFASSENTFSVSPFYKELTLTKNDQESGFDLEVKNDTANSTIFKLSVLDFGSLDETGGVAFQGSIKLENKYSLASWVKLQTDALVLDAGQAQKIHVTIENKESLSPGGHYAAVMLKVADDENGGENKETQVAVNPTATSLIFVRKEGGEIFNMNLNNQQTPHNFWSLPSLAKLRFQNAGNVHLTPYGSISLIDPLGRVVEKGIINEDSGIILPETFRIFNVKMLGLASAFIPGKYELNITYHWVGNPKNTIVHSSIFIFPLLSMLIFAVLAVFLFLGYKKVFQYKEKH